MQELLAIRSPGSVPSLLYPVPGEVRDSIQVAHADGVPGVYPFDRVALGSGRRRRSWYGPGALIVTDCRTALASSAHREAPGSMLVGQVRHPWLVEVAAARDTVRLILDHPSQGRTSVEIVLCGAAAAESGAADIAARACRHEGDRLLLGQRRGEWFVAATAVNS